MIKVKVKNDKCTPKRAFESDAGLDLVSNEKTFLLKAGEKKKVGTGVIFQIGVGFFGMVVPRSGLGAKFEVILANSVGVIDSGYRGEVFVFLKNNDSVEHKIEQFQRIAQLILLPCALDNCQVVEHIAPTTRGDSGFGDSGH